MAQRAMVLVGVAKTGGLPELQAVGDGVRRMREWAESQGIAGDRLVVLTDDADKVRAHQVVDAIGNLVEPRTLDQLIVYFSGHGIHNRGDYWLLSNAPGQSGEAVNVEGSLQLARYCGVPHVVLVSDCCRTAAEGIQAQGVVGTEIFPNDPVDGLERPVDAFFSCARGKPSLEVRDVAESSGAYSALYTEVLADCLNGRVASVVERVQEQWQDVGLVRAWKLSDELTTLVPPRLAAKLGRPPTVNQMPVGRITSHEGWVSRVAAPPVPPRERIVMHAAPRVNPVAAADTLVTTALAGDAARLGTLLGDMPPDATSTLLGTATQTLAKPFGPTHFETGCGFKVRGARVAAVHSPSSGTEVLDAERTLLRVTPGAGGAASVLIVLDDGSSALLPAIPDFLGELTFDDGELAHVAYEPSDRSWRWAEYVPRIEELRSLRATIAAAAGLGVFRLTGENAPQLARSMQFAKLVDPSMALYAAYAYHDLARRDRIREMQSYLLGDLNVALFDIALLADDGNLPALLRDRKVLPPFPLLSQGWPLLSAFRAPLPAALVDLQRHLKPSLWTLFDAAGTNAVLNAFSNGDIRR